MTFAASRRYVSTITTGSLSGDRYIDSSSETENKKWKARNDGYNLHQDQSNMPDRSSLGTIFHLCWTTWVLGTPQETGLCRFSPLRTCSFCLWPGSWCSLFFQIVVFVIYALELKEMGTPVTATSGVAMYSPLVYTPSRRYEAWRYLTYMLMHQG